MHHNANTVRCGTGRNVVGYDEKVWEERKRGERQGMGRGEERLREARHGFVRQGRARLEWKISITYGEGIILLEPTLQLNEIVVIVVAVLVTQSCLTLCDPMDCSQPAFSVHRTLQARILEWFVISFSRGSS